jgi:hypothetical protein
MFSVAAFISHDAHHPRPLSPQKLYSFAGDFRAFKALIAAQYNGVKIVSVARSC